MSEDLINKVIDAPAVKKQMDVLYAQLQQVVLLIQQINQAGASISFARGLSETAKAAQDAKAKVEELKVARQQLINQEQELKNQASAAARAADAQAKADANASDARLRQIQEQTAAVRQQAAAERLARQQAAQAAKDAAAAAKLASLGEVGSRNQLNNELKKAIAIYDTLGAASRKSASGKELLASIQQLHRELSVLEADTGRFQRNVGNYPKALGGVTSLLGTFGVVTGGAAIAKEIFDTTVQLDSLNSALRAVSKTEEEFQSNQKFLADTANRLGLSVIDLTKAYKLFYTASTQSGLSAVTTRKIFSSVSETAATLKLSTDDTNGVLLAFSQILGKGKVQAEELRGQIGERLPGAFAIAARSIGVTEQELNKMLQKGQVISADFLPKFATELQKTFGVNGQEPVQGLQASINRLSNAFATMISDNQGGLTKLFQGIIDLARGALESINNFTAGIGYVIEKITDADAAARHLNTKAVKDYAESLKNVKTEDLLTRTSNLSKNIDVLNNRLTGNKKLIEDIKKAYGADAESVYGSFIKKTQDLIEEDERMLDLTTKSRAAARGEVDSRLKPGDDLNAAKPKVDLTEAEKNRLAKLRELRIQALTDNQKFEIQSELDTQKKIIDNNGASTAERLAATEKYYTKKKELSELDATNDKNKLKEEIARGRAVPEQLIAIDNRAKKELVDNQLDLSANITKILANDADDRVKLATNTYTQEGEIIEKAANKELAQNQDLYTKGLITKEQYEDEKLRIDNKYAILQLQNQLELQKKILDIISTTSDPDKIKEARSKISDIENKIRDLDLKYFEDTEKKKTEREKLEAAKRKKLKEDELVLVKKLGKESLDFIFSIVDAQFDKQKEGLQKQADELDVNTQKEIEAVNASAGSEQEKADKITVINARAQAQKEEIDRRQRKIDLEKARFDRLKSIGEVIANTAVNIVKVFPNPVLIALAAAVGAVQLGSILATPLPRYRYGTKDHKGGKAMVNDGGRLEVMESPTGKAFVATGKDAIVNLPEHYKVHTSIEDYYAASGSSNYRSVVTPDGKLVELKLISDRMERNAAQQTQELLAGMERNRSSVSINYTWQGIEVSQKTISGRIDYLSKNIRL